MNTTRLAAPFLGVAIPGLVRRKPVPRPTPLGRAHEAGTGAGLWYRAIIHFRKKICDR
jgi:hypothetical protein